MRKANGKILAAGFTVSALLILSASPALSLQCVKKHPLFGVDVYMSGKACQKKAEGTPEKVEKPEVETSASAAKKALTRRSVARRSDIKKMQEMLTRVGYHPGPADGFSGPETQKALGYFKGNYGLADNASHKNVMAVLSRVDKQTAANAKAAQKPVTFEGGHKPVASSSAKASPKLKKVQMLLAKIGYVPGRADGVAKPATTTALAYFKQNYGLADNASHDKVVAALERAANPVTSTSEPMHKTTKASGSASELKAIQSGLTKLGYVPGPANGVASPATDKAISYFKQNYGLADNASHSNVLMALNQLSK